MDKNMRRKLNEDEVRKQRIIDEAMYYLENETTIRDVGREFHLSKSTVYQDFTMYLPKYDLELAELVKSQLAYNWECRLDRMKEHNPNFQKHRLLRKS